MKTAVVLRISDLSSDVCSSDLCGRFFIAPPHDRLVRDYLPATLVVRAADDGADGHPSASAHLARLMDLMRVESSGDRLGGHAMLNALSAALFALAVRTASESEQAPDRKSTRLNSSH